MENYNKVFGLVMGGLLAFYATIPFMSNYKYNHDKFVPRADGGFNVSVVTGYTSSMDLSIRDRNYILGDTELGSASLNGTVDDVTNTEWELIDSNRDGLVDIIDFDFSVETYGDIFNREEHYNNFKQLFDRADIAYNAALDKFEPLFFENGFDMPIKR
jgi:hypothetical protein